MKIYNALDENNDIVAKKDLEKKLEQQNNKIVALENALANMGKGYDDKPILDRLAALEGNKPKNKIEVLKTGKMLTKEYSVLENSSQTQRFSFSEADFTPEGLAILEKAEFYTVLFTIYDKISFKNTEKDNLTIIGSQGHTAIESAPNLLDIKAQVSGSWRGSLNVVSFSGYCTLDRTKKTANLAVNIDDTIFIRPNMSTSRGKDIHTTVTTHLTSKYLGTTPKEILYLDTTLGYKAIHDSLPYSVGLHLEKIKVELVGLYREVQEVKAK